MFLNWRIKPNNTPIIKVIIIINFLFKGKKNNCSGDIIHDSHVPDVIANNLNVIIGIIASMDLWFHDNEFNLMEDLLDNIDIRNEYDAVIPIDKIISINIRELKLEKIIFSKIISFEKNPDMNGIPIKANLFTPKIDKIIGKLMKLSPIIRISW